jgi:hypothetical protein
VVKYVCQHSVIGRVEIERVLNPEAWYSRDTYLKARVTLLDPPTDAQPTDAQPTDAQPTDAQPTDAQPEATGAQPEATAESSAQPGATNAPSEEAAAESSEGGGSVEARVVAAFERLVGLQVETKEMPRFTTHMLRTLNVSETAQDKHPWQAIGAWHTLQEQRVAAVQQRMQADLSRRVLDFLRAKGGADAPVPPRVRLEDLPAEVRTDLAKIQDGYRSQLEELRDTPHGEPFQLLLQARSHEERLSLFLEMIEQECERLGRRASLQRLFNQS